MGEGSIEQAVMPDAAALDKVHAAIAAYNAERPQQENTMQVRVTFIVGGYVVLAFFILLILYNDYRGAFGYGFGIAVFGSWWVWDMAMQPTKTFQQDLRDRLLPVIFGFVDRVRYSKGDTPRFMEHFPKKALMRYGHSIHDDAISGAYDGMDFMLSETELASGSGKNKQVLFKGVVFHFVRPVAFDGILSATKRPTGLMKFLFGSEGLELVKSGNVFADASHEFRTDRPGPETERLLGPLGAALEYLSQTWRDGEVRIALTGTEGFLLVPSSKNFFELPDIAHDIDFDRHVRPMIRDLVTLLVTARLVSKIGESPSEAPNRIREPGLRGSL
ncbi:hypothetical protein [Pararhizobium sp.]|uniref:hypothetical protein n=1 Tax=Pararhizobium sp. TaxID=1977563 RepID=UPI0027224C95|nr:hypothetical protein [Pararhizobium sp.]MDO9419005.1 hypothetical protein [Pararhizobium sp.]